MARCENSEIRKLLQRLEVQQKSASKWQKNPNRMCDSPLDLLYR